MERNVNVGGSDHEMRARGPSRLLRSQEASTKHRDGGWAEGGHEDGEAQVS